MIDIDWIIDEENNFTDKAKFNLGDNYMLSIEFLKLFCNSIISFSRNNEVAHCFETQIVKDFHLAVLNAIRRHTTISNYLIRHAIESIVLFVYSMENKDEESFKVGRDSIGIISFDDKVLEKAYKFFEKDYPEESRILEGYKEFINKYYSHSNIYSAQYNTAIIDDRVKLLVFDNYFDDYIRNTLLVYNEIMSITFKLYIKLHEKYKIFYLDENFCTEFNELLKRHNKNVIDSMNEENKINQEFPDAFKIMDKLDKKYEIN